MDEFELTIDKVVPGGLGLGFSAGKAVFVPFSAPGDRLLVQVEKQYKNHSRAVIKDILTPGPDRVEPGCPVYGSCGGCQLRHLSGPVQSQAKVGFIQESLQRIGKIEPEGIVSNLKTASPVSGYRRRAGFKVRVVKRGVLLGFFALGSHRVVDIPDCPILEPRLSALIEPLRTFIAALDGRERVPEVDCVAGDHGIGLVFHTLRPFSPADQERLKSFAKEQKISQLWLQSGKKARLRSFYDEAPLGYGIDGLSLSFKPGDFIQVNGAGNRLLVDEAMAASGASLKKPGAVAWDLFCGVGNVTLPLSKRFEKVHGVESLSSALDRLRDNSRSVKQENIHTLRSDLFKKDGLARLKDLGSADLVLLDPPRNGAQELVQKIAEDPPKRVVYISCDPATFSRDAGILVKSGLKLHSVTPLDMFPQTKHVEMVGLFLRDKKES